jgi:predicted hydrocarbon binding protein
MNTILTNRVWYVHNSYRRKPVYLSIYSAVRATSRGDGLGKQREESMTSDERMATNMAIRAGIVAVEEIMGENATKIIFNNAGKRYLYDSPPELNFEPCIKVSEQAAIYRAIMDLMGFKGGIVLWRRIGYSIMKSAAEIGHILDSFDALSPAEKFNKGMEVFVMGSGKGKLVTNAEGIAEFDSFDCFSCQGYSYTRPVCAHYEGIVQFLSDWAFGKDVYLARETLCMAKGDKTCYVKIVKKD